MAIRSVIHTNKHSIDRVLEAGLPVVLVFWQKDLPSIGVLNVTLDQVAEEFSGKALIAKLDADEEKELQTRYKVAQIPGFVFIRNGQVEKTIAGPLKKDEIVAWLSYLTGEGPKPQGTTAGSRNDHRANGHRANGHHANEHQTHPQGKPRNVNDSELSQLVTGSLPVLVDLWAPWCGPCRAVAPSIEQLAQEFAGRAVVAKVNVDENPQTSSRFQVQGIPTLLIFKNGQLVERLVGAQPLPVLRQALAKHTG